MNSKFEKYKKKLAENVSKKELVKILEELHSSFSILSQEEQKIAKEIIYGIQSGNIEVEDSNKTFRDYINERKSDLENYKIKKVVENVGCSEELLRYMYNKGVTENNISEHGTFDELKESCDEYKAEKFFKEKYGEEYSSNRISMYNDCLLYTSPSPRD